MITVIDTDAWLAIINPSDALHPKAKAVLKALYEQNAHLLLLPTTLSEFATVATDKIGLERTKDIVKVLIDAETHVLLEIDDALTAKAVEVFFEQTSKKESLFDCFVMAASRKYKADCIFSFDNGYTKTKNGFKLAADLLKINY